MDSSDRVAAPGRLSDEARLAVKNAFKLGLSLVASLGVATLVRLYLPRHLGPEAFGVFSFAEGFTLTCFGFLSMGVDGYSLREISARPAHASDYFGGLVAVRTLLAALLVPGLVALVARTGPPGSAPVVAAFGLGYLLFSIGNSLAAFLQANGTVDRLAVSNVVGKLMWGGLILAAIVAGAPLWFLPLAFAASEAAKAVLLYRESRRQIGLAFRLDWRETRSVLWAAVPYFATSVAIYLNRSELAVLGFMAGEHEVGWYGAAGGFSMLVFLLYPLMASVLLPTLRRVHARSEDELWRILQQVAEGILFVCVPLALVVALGADIWVRLAFGGAFAAAASSLRVLALQALFTYMASLTSLALIVIGRRWTVTAVSMVAVAAGPLAAFAFIPILARWLGPGGAGAGAALATVATEAFVMAVQGALLGAQAVVARTLRLMAKCLCLGAVVVGLHLVLAPLGPARLVADALVYVALGIPLGMLPLAKLLRLAREISASRPPPLANANPS